MTRRERGGITKEMFIEADGQLKMFEKSLEQEIVEGKHKEVECLGITFPNDEERRNYFLDKLQEKLKDPEFRKIEGFPIGTDEDILALSDPPYYTACPNPFITDFIKQYGKPYDPATDNYRREPFATDVSEGKNDPIYNAHSYHTKVPHKAIMRYILHYTEPGDVVFDGFSGTGMTGVAAQLCGDKVSIEELGLSIGEKGLVRDGNGDPFGQIGFRRAILNDLSPAATLIASGYNLTTDAKRFAKLAGQLLVKFETEYGWMYQTVDPKTQKLCPVSYTIWSEVFTCPQCSGELEFWALAYDEKTGKVAEKTKCPYCRAEVHKRELVRKTTNFFDQGLNKTRQRQVLKPVLINFKSNGQVKQKTPDQKDLEVLKRIEDTLSSLHYPTDLMMFVPEDKEWGDLYRGYHKGISRVHDFHLPRQLAALSLLWQMGGQLKEVESKRLWQFMLQSVLVSFTRRNRFLKNAFSQVNRGLSGTLYIGSTISEPSPRYVLEGKIRRFAKAIPAALSPIMVSTQSLTTTAFPSESVDYVFIDPPFGDNLPYAELNFLWEAWLRVFTNVSREAVVSGYQRKSLTTYSQLMADCLKEVYRVLKPGRWVTVEFHNSKNAVWTAIQEAMGRAGFIIADVRILDKGMLTKKQLNANAVNRDLVISAYKPNGGLEERFKLVAETEEGVWAFIRSHLKQLPVFVVKDGQAEGISERQNYLLFDRMVAFHVQRGVIVPVSAAEFYQGITQRFSERDGMYFLSEQVAEYDKKRLTVREVLQMEIAPCDEASSIEWLRQQLTKKPQTFQELHPQFLKEIGGWQKHEKTLELSELLEQNFLRYDAKGPIPAQVVSWLKCSDNFRKVIEKGIEDSKFKIQDSGAIEILSDNLESPNLELKRAAHDRWYVPDPNKAGDLEKLRERTLLREFQEYKESKQRRLKVFRLEAVRAGFKKAWQERDYTTIIAVASKIPETILQEDPKLLMWYDQATTRIGG